MKNKSLCTVTLLLLARLTLTAASTNGLVGDWRGTLDTGLAKLRLVFRVTNAPNGGLTAKLDSIDQGAVGIPVDSVSVTNNTLQFEVKLVKGVYKGTLDAAKTKATGLWSQGGGEMPLTLEKGKGKDSDEGEALSPSDLAASKLAAQRIAGTWEGKLDTGVASLRLRVNISKTPSGTATGTMDSLDQGANGIPLTAITLKEGKVHFEVRGVGGLYEGTLSTNSAALKGEWQQGGASLPLDFTKASK